MSKKEDIDYKNRVVIAHIINDHYRRSLLPMHKQIYLCTRFYLIHRYYYYLYLLSGRKNRFLRNKMNIYFDYFCYHKCFIKDKMDF